MEVKDQFEVITPIDFTPLHIDVQGNEIYLWAEVDPDTEVGRRLFFCRGTGHHVEMGLDYIGTVLQRPFVWHFFWYENRGFED